MISTAAVMTAATSVMTATTSAMTTATSAMTSTTSATTIIEFYIVFCDTLEFKELEPKLRNVAIAAEGGSLMWCSAVPSVVHPPHYWVKYGLYLMDM